MATLLSVQDLGHSHGSRPLFTGLTFGIDDGERIGLIGPNGAGKSTLLALLAGEDRPDRGTLSLRRGLRVEKVAQEESFDEALTVDQTLHAALASDPIDDAERAARVEVALAQCGFPDRDQATGALSGGWRKRLAIACALVREPDLLLLDEPTNHLDLAGVEWLEDLLESATFAFIVVTHDRYFLENVATRLIDLNPGYAEGFLSVEGGYSDYLERRAAYFASQGRRQDALETQAKHELAWLRRGARARSTKAKGRIEDAGELFAEIEGMKNRLAERATLAAEGFTSSGRKTRELIVGKGLAKAMGGRTLFSGLDLMLGPGKKLGIVGANGSGKTTLLRLLSGNLPPDAGTLRRADGLKVVWFDQNRAGLDRSVTVRDALSPNSDTVEYRGSPLHVSAWAKRFGFAEVRLGAKVGTLSGGEQARILIARLMLVTADVLILDEPTNDLDLESLQALEDGLVTFPGALVLVSHDRFFLDTVANEVLVLGEGAPSFYADYAQWAQRRRERAEAAVPRPVAKVASAAPRPGLTATERRELSKMEETILAAEERVAQIDARMNDPEVATDAAALRNLWEIDLPAAKAEVERLYARWEELEARKG